MTVFQPSNERKKNRVPCCPNHGEPLEGLPSPLTTKGTGMCPVSGAIFDYSAQFDGEGVEYEKDHTGNLVAIPTYHIVGEENV